MIRRFVGVIGLWAMATTAQAESVNNGSAAMLRGLDKLSGNLEDITLAVGSSTTFGRLTIRLSECRYPEGNPAGNAYAHLTIQEVGHDTAVFTGWMVATAPALNALDHPRYDVWVLRCKTE